MASCAPAVSMVGGATRAVELTIHTVRPASRAATALGVAAAIASDLNDLLTERVEPVLVPARPGDVRDSQAAVDKAGQYAYRDRKVRKRNFRSLWIQRINAAARLEGFTYSQFIHGLDLSGIEMDRKVLADIAGADPVAFKAIADKVRAALA